MTMDVTPGSDARINVEASIDLGVRHHRHLLPETVASLFEHPPQTLRAGAADDVGFALGASLYMPALMPNICGRITDLAMRTGLTSAVLCLEDAVADADLSAAEENLCEQIQMLRLERPPVFIFVRPRTPDHLWLLGATLNSDLSAVTGFALPKFTSDNGPDWLEALECLRSSHPHLVAMPILEGAEILNPGQRTAELRSLGALLGAKAGVVAAIRIGATDLSGLLGIRRSRSSSVYDVPPLSNAVGDIIAFWRTSSTRHVVAASVWEYFHTATERLPDLGLIRECERDVEYGLVGKSVVHPSQIRIVNATLSVQWADWEDACLILSGAGGVSSSANRDRMNEHRPHLEWANQIQRRAAVFGVLREGVEPVDLAVAI